jgi:site-specific recombinase XerD
MKTDALVSRAEALIERAAAYVEANVTESTRKSYAQDWKMFERWCRARDLNPDHADDAGVAVYLAWMADQGYAPASIERAWVGVYVSIRVRNPDAHKGELCRRVLRGIRRTSTYKTKEKRPLVAGELAALLDHVGGGALGLRNRALLLVGFAGGFRRSELVALDLEDLAFSAEGLRVRLRRSKTDQEGRGQEKGLARARGELCPVQALSHWLDYLNAQKVQTTEQRPELATEDQDGSKVQKNAPVFPAMDRWGHLLGRRITPVCVANVLKTACRRAGIDVAAYGAHSLRAGFVTEAATRRKPLDAIMRQTGHKSVEQLLTYIRHAQVFQENASEGIFDE